MGNFESLNKQRLYWICQIGGWSLYGIVNLLGYSYTRTITQSLLIGEVFQVGFYLLSTHLLRLHIKRRDWFGLPWNKLIPRLLASTFLLSVTNSTINYILVTGLSSRQATDLIVFIIFSFIVYFLWVLIYFVFHYFESYRKSLQYEASMNEIELNNLKSQLNPHFIFNALNSIRALVDENPSKSKDAITQLSNILRNSLALDKKQLIDFSDEIRTVKDYLALETIRFEERLKTEIDIHPKSDLFKVPPMMIQTLVENGIKHGVSNLKKGGKIKLTTDVVDDIFIIKILNSGKYLNGINKRRSGYGLENTRKRLKLIYGDLAYFDIGNVEEGTVLTEIHIPEYVPQNGNYTNWIEKININR